MKNTLSLKDTKEFQKVLKRGKWYGGNYISVYIFPNQENKNYLGLAIGKKVGKANRRNRVKRIIRAAYTECEKNVKFGYSIVCVWRVKADFDKLTFLGMQKDLEKIFQKAGMINE